MELELEILMEKKKEIYYLKKENLKEVKFWFVTVYLALPHQMKCAPRISSSAPTGAASPTRGPATARTIAATTVTKISPLFVKVRCRYCTSPPLPRTLLLHPWWISKRRLTWPAFINSYPHTHARVGWGEGGLLARRIWNLAPASNRFVVCDGSWSAVRMQTLGANAVPSILRFDWATIGALISVYFFQFFFICYSSWSEFKKKIGLFSGKTTSLVFLTADLMKLTAKCVVTGRLMRAKHRSQFLPRIWLFESGSSVAFILMR